MSKSVNIGARDSVNKYHRQRSDSNQAGIVKELRSIGCTVFVVSATCKMDIIVGWRGNNYLFEIKQPGKELRASQKELHASWNGQIDRAESFEDCMRIMED